MDASSIQKPIIGGFDWGARTADTIGIITALSEEYTATCKAMGCSVEVMAPGSGPGRRYSLASIPSLLGGRHVVAVTKLVIPGNNCAAIQAAKMSEQFKPRHIIMVGIAGAVPNPGKAEAHVRLGDLVMSGPQGVVQYDFDKETLEPPRKTSFFDRIFNLGSWSRLDRMQTAIEHRHFPQ